MKVRLFFLLAFIATSVSAQQAPAAAGTPSPPRGIAPPPATMSNEEIVTLLRAQTAAIKALSSKLENVEQRVNQIDKREH
ncbi:MAG: hypothetical protein JWM78_2262 [Verrucomicrobiaceae bacterium]|nr:hypothetical protein [Verrucomicrobiaceae bacterium]